MRSSSLFNITQNVHNVKERPHYYLIKFTTPFSQVLIKKRWVGMCQVERVLKLELY